MAQTRVLHLMQCTYLGGTEQTMYTLMRGLQGAEYGFQIVSLHPPGDGAELMATAGIPTAGHAYRGRFGWRTHWSLRRTIARTPCDLVLVTGPTVSGSLALGATPTQRRVLTIHHHHGSSPGARRLWQAFYRMYGHQYHVITYLTDFIRREAEAIAPWIAPRARVVRAPAASIGRVDDEARRAFKRSFGLDEAAPVIGSAGRLVTPKRPDVFLDVAVRVARRCPEAQFVVAGGGPLQTELERRAEHLGLASRMHFLGWLRDTDRFFGALDAFLFTSDADAFGRTPMEAMAVGVPVVASVVYGGTDEIIEHGHNGILLPEHDIDALSGHLLDLLENPALRETRIANGLATVRARHGSEAFLRAYRAIFEETLAA
ncbi:MAG: glycosyltransferase [Phycisphaerae bacterium]|nr:glycosyltransferase [Phycisphaerae bacterium]